jgi:RNA polymerase sigma factor (sigma-70 family)
VEVSGNTLVGRVLSGDERSLDRLVDAAWPRAALRHPRALPSGDLRQEAYEELIATARRYDPARDGDFAALAVARVRRRLERVLRADRRGRPQTVRLEALPGPAGSSGRPGPWPDEPAGNPRLARALGTLSPRLRAVIVRSYGRGMSDAEIAVEYGLSPAALERARRRATALLRDELRGPRPRGRPPPTFA